MASALLTFLADGTAATGNVFVPVAASADQVPFIIYNESPGTILLDVSHSGGDITATYAVYNSHNVVSQEVANLDSATEMVVPPYGVLRGLVSNAATSSGELGLIAANTTSNHNTGSNTGHFVWLIS